MKEENKNAMNSKSAHSALGYTSLSGGIGIGSHKAARSVSKMAESSSKVMMWWLVWRPI